VGKTRTPEAPSATDLIWQWARFGDLSAHELYAALQLREAVFVVEQKCPYPDADGRDPNAWHLLGWLDTASGRRLVAYARVFEPGVRYTEGSIGRVATSTDMRRFGFGKALMAEALRRLDSLAPGQTIKVAAQRYLENFYSGFGFRTASAPYEEDGIMHIDMLRKP
jgi:ElaA protein